MLEITGTEHYTLSGNYRDGTLLMICNKLGKKKWMVTDALMEAYKF